MYEPQQIERPPLGEVTAIKVGKETLVARVIADKKHNRSIYVPGFFVNTPYFLVYNNEKAEKADKVARISCNEAKYMMEDFFTDKDFWILDKKELCWLIGVLDVYWEQIMHFIKSPTPIGLAYPKQPDYTLLFGEQQMVKKFRMQQFQQQLDREEKRFYMFERRYYVVDENGNTVARNMNLEMALLMMKAYAIEYYNDTICLTLREEERTDVDSNSDRK